MKKFLLILCAAVLGVTSANAVVDPNTYDEVDGLKIQNVWLLDRAHAGDAFTKLDACNTRARTAVMTNGIVYVSRSEAKAVVPAPGDTVSASVIYRFDAKTGEQLPDLDVTLDGAPYGAFLGVNSIGVDNFGHVWVAPYTSENASSVPFYSLNTETGELTKIATLDKGEVIARTDYYDVIGDITREEASVDIINAATGVATVYRWHCDQGGAAEDFEGGFDGDTYIDILDFYPETVTQWSYGPYAKFVLGEDEETMYDGELFYIDGFNSMPALYDMSGSLVDSFENVETSLWPEVGANGVAEFHIDGKNFLVYTIAQYTGVDEKTLIDHACQANIVELGEGMALEGMTKYWQIPADRLGDVSDGGNRIHMFNVEYATEDDAEVVYLFDFKCYNGMGVYKIGTKLGEGPGPQPLKGDVDGNGVVNVSDVTELVNMILGTVEKNAAADVDGNGVVNVSDVTYLVNIILGAVR